MYSFVQKKQVFKMASSILIISKIDQCEVHSNLKFTDSQRDGCFKTKCWLGHVLGHLGMDKCQRQGTGESASISQPCPVCLLSYRRFCLPISHRPLCPAPSDAFVRSSREHPASNQQPLNTNVQVVRHEGRIGKKTRSQCRIRVCVCVHSCTIIIIILMGIERD